SKLAPGTAKTDFNITINARPLRCQRLAEDVGWCTWGELCDGPRSQNDYIELARQFHTVILSDVPVMNWEMENQARRFINLIDEFYDRNVKLIISAAAPITQIYTGKRVEFEIERTQSRLLEMQSNDYLAQPHLP
ncbi:MAG: AFG1/ZapE family ATPase, partial [Gammaproteobacteria bacterium]|nr:AFG1/ZapE family ATPase [Gammaproteobacteria bacterium]